jgi:hypothetical protein
MKREGKSQEKNQERDQNEHTEKKEKAVSLPRCLAGGWLIKGGVGG